MPWDICGPSSQPVDGPSRLIMIFSRSERLVSRLAGHRAVSKVSQCAVSAISLTV